ncbi:MAG: hypothetical protein RSA99_00730 [Oscillospiraceae bacterium]
MQPQSMFLDYVVKKIKSLAIFDNVSIGQLQIENCLSIEVVAGFEEKYLNKKAKHTITILFLHKHINQLKAYDLLCCLENYLAKLCHIITPNFELINVEINGSSQYVDKQDDGKYIYSLTTNFNIYF